MICFQYLVWTKTWIYWSSLGQGDVGCLSGIVAAESREENKFYPKSFQQIWTGFGRADICFYIAGILTFILRDIEKW